VVSLFQVHVHAHNSSWTRAASRVVTVCREDRLCLRPDGMRQQRKVQDVLLHVPAVRQADDEEKVFASA
jgi:hypothetical protein